MFNLIGNVLGVFEKKRRAGDSVFERVDSHCWSVHQYMIKSFMSMVCCFAPRKAERIYHSRNIPVPTL